ncbi:MAG: hypothetical protein D6722_21315, partial [Bacteroidetes bacterium]
MPCLRCGTAQRRRFQKSHFLNPRLKPHPRNRSLLQGAASPSTLSDFCYRSQPPVPHPLRLLLLASILASWPHVRAQSDSLPLPDRSFVLRELPRGQSLDAYVGILPAPFPDMRIDQVLANRHQQNFQPLASLVQPLDPERQYWLRLRLSSQLSQPVRLMLANPNVGYADFYLPESDSSWTREPTGRYLPEAQKAAPRGDYANVPLDLAPGER